MNGRCSRIRLGQRIAIQFRFQPTDHRLLLRGFRVRHSQRRHFAGAHLAQYFFPSASRFANRSRFHTGERQICCLVFIVVATDAVTFHRGIGLRGISQRELRKE